MFVNYYEIFNGIKPKTGARARHKITDPSQN